MKRICVVIGLLIAYNFSFAQGDRDLDDLFVDYKIIKNNLSSQIASQDGNSIKVDFREISYHIGQIQIEEVDLYQRDYRLHVLDGSGAVVTRPNHVKAYKSTDPRYPIRITADESFAYGYVDDQVSKIFFEPLSHFDPTANPNDIIVYDEHSVQDKTLKCGANADYHVGDVNQIQSDDDHKSNNVCRVVEVAIASDYSMYQAYGSVQAVENHAIGVLNNVQGNYDDEFADQIEFRLVEQQVSTCSTCDPWTSSVASGSILESFTSWGPSGFTQDHDIGTLWTKRNLDNGNTVGIAWVSSVCTNYKYNVCQDFSSNAASKRVLLAHEMGHNFGAGHDAQGQGTIMAPSVNNTNTWSSQSLDVIQNFVSSLGCLNGACDGGDTETPGGDNAPTCGDGMQNGDESGIDCGGVDCDPCAGPVPNCTDGIQNGDEEGVDCGGPDCSPCQGAPTSCADGVQNGNETGIDCGGSCPPCGTFCLTGGQDSFFEYIQKVQVGSTIHNSGNDGGYRDFTNKTFHMKTGLSAAIRLEPGYGEQIYEEYWQIWIDLNQDNIFTVDELVFQGQGEERVSGNIILPSDTDKMITRMRVSVSWGDYAPVCGDFDFGETEDYTIQIDPIGAPSCSDGRQNGDETGVDCGGSCPPCETGLVKLESGQVSGVGSGWKKVTLSQYYTSMVVVTAPVYPDANRDPVLTRIRHAGGNSFEVKLQSPGGGKVKALNVQYLVVEEGVYTQATHGIQMEAVRYNSLHTSTSRSWKINAKNPQLNYSAPVIIGQVMTNHDNRWSTFFATSATQISKPPVANSISIGKHVGESISQYRNNEIIGYIIVEAGSGMINGQRYEAGLSPRVINSIVSSSAGIPINLNIVQGSGLAFLGISGMGGNNGCWPVLVGQVPVSNGRLRCAVDEDTDTDNERYHINEHIAYLVVGSSNNLQDDQNENTIMNRSYDAMDMSIQVTPNPASDRISVDINLADEVVVRMLSMAGQEIMRTRGSEKIQIGVSDIEPGLYLIEVITSAGETSIRKFVKS